MKFNIPKKFSNKPGGLLASLWGEVIKDKNLTQSKLFILLSRYLSKKSSDDKDEVRKNKATMKNNIEAKDMTWSTFTYLIFEFLNTRKMTITINLVDDVGKETVHSIETINGVLQPKEVKKIEELLKEAELKVKIKENNAKRRAKYEIDKKPE